MPSVDVILNPLQLPDVKDSVAVVIDVLRASSTITTALANGARAVIPAGTIREAVKIAADYPGALLAGERNAKKPPHFDLGNSPFEFGPEKVAGKVIIFSTSNGTRIIKRIDPANQIVIGSFLNAYAVSRYVRQQKKDALLYCAGNNGRFALEDALCAAWIVNELRDFSLYDAAYWTLKSAIKFFPRKAKDEIDYIYKAISESQHGDNLKSLGLDTDMLYCSQLDIYDFVPILKEGKFIKSNNL